MTKSAVEAVNVSFTLQSLSEEIADLIETFEKRKTALEPAIDIFVDILSNKEKFDSLARNEELKKNILSGAQFIQQEMRTQDPIVLKKMEVLITMASMTQRMVKHANAEGVPIV